MRLVVKKLDVVDLEHLQSLVIEHLDAIEPGLTVLDCRLLLGHATIDIVALDESGALVLAAVGFTADEEMLLKAVEAYSWCLEYPDAIRRLYPAVDISAARPPRLMFVVERLPDAFHRKIKQLGFSEVDCVEFRHLDVSGTAAAYFDTIARLRRGGSLAERTHETVVRRAPESIVRRAPEPVVRHAPEPVAAERPVDKVIEKVVPLGTPTAARATSVRLQKLLNNGASDFAVEARPARATERPAAPVIEITSRVAAAAAPRVETLAAPVAIPAPRVETPAPRIETPAPRIETPTPRVDAPAPRLEAPVPRVEAPVPRVEAPAPRVEADTPRVEAPKVEAPRLQAPKVVEVATAVIEPVARVSLREAVPAPAIAVEAAAPVAPVRAAQAQAPEPRVSFADLAKELLGTTAVQPRMDAPTVIPRPPVEEITRAALEDIMAAAADAIAEPPSAVAVEAEPVAVAVEDEPLALAVEEPVAIEEPVIEPIVDPAPIVAPAPVVAAAPAPVVAAPAPAPVPEPAAPAPAAPSLPQEFEGLKFPNDGVLTRQWMEFLNQMAATK